MYHLGNTDLEICVMVECHRNKILNRYEVEHHKYSVWGLLFLTLSYRRRSLSPNFFLWHPSYSKTVSSLPAWLGGLVSRSEVLGPSSWHEFCLGGADKRIHSLMTLLLTALADQIPCGTNLPVVIFLLLNVDYLSLIAFFFFFTISQSKCRFGNFNDHLTYEIYFRISTWFVFIGASSCLKLEWLLMPFVALGQMGCREGGTGRRGSSLALAGSTPSITGGHQTLPLPVRKEPSFAPFQLSSFFLCLFSF